jgi:hypothetical protein
MYPPHQQGLLIEEFAQNYFKTSPNIPNCQYIPINWTGWYCNNEYGKGTPGIRNYVRDLKLPKGKYFTIVQNDTGTMCENILREMGCTIFGCGGIGDEPLPLLCDPHPVQERRNNTKYLASFVGNLNTHEIRRKMLVNLTGDSRFFIGRGGSNLFRALMADSTFALCPRGFGKTSYRLYEAIQLGVIPVYIYDEPWLPYQDIINWISFCVLLPFEMFGCLRDVLGDFSKEKIAEIQFNLDKVRPMFTMQYACEYAYKKMTEICKQV